jgi:hypothetical protein
MAPNRKIYVQIGVLYSISGIKPSYFKLFSRFWIYLEMKSLGLNAKNKKVFRIRRFQDCHKGT